MCRMRGERTDQCSRVNYDEGGVANVGSRDQVKKQSSMSVSGVLQSPMSIGDCRDSVIWVTIGVLETTQDEKGMAWILLTF